MRRPEYQSALVVMFGLAFATLTGYFRQAVAAYILGSGRIADIYLVAFAIPEFVMIALPIVFSPVIIPFFSQIRLQHGSAQAWRWGSRLSAWMAIFLLAATLVAGLGAPTFIRWLSPGFEVGEQILAVQTFNRMLPGLMLLGASVFVGSLLQSYRRFAWPVLTTAVYNLVFMVSLLALVGYSPLERAGWGVTLGASAALLIQIPLFWRLRSDELKHASRTEADPVNLSESLRMLGWMTAGYAVHHLILFIDRAMATGLGAGSVAILNYGYHLALAVGQLSGLSISTAIFPGLSEKVGLQDLEGSRGAISQGISLVWAFAFPASLALFVLRVPIVQLFLEHGAFLPSATRAVANVLGIYAFAVLADALCQPFWRLVYAARSGSSTLAINAVQTIIRLIANLLLISRLGIQGLALSAVIGLGFQVIVLAYFAKRKIGWRLPPAGWSFAFAVLLSGAVAFGVTSLVQRWSFTPGLGLSVISILGINTVVFVALYILLGLFMLKILRKTEGFASGKNPVDFIQSN